MTDFPIFAVVLGLASAVAIGYLARSAGLCLVRGVADACVRDFFPLLGLLACGFWIYAYVLVRDRFAMPEVLLVHELDWRFPIGGLIFGIGAAFNGGCAISTFSRGFSGDLRMAVTAVGWLTGALLYSSNWIIELPAPAVASASVSTIQATAGIAVLLCSLAVVRWRWRESWPFWRAAMLVGMLSCVLFITIPKWDPSTYVIASSLAVFADFPAPSWQRAAVLAALGAGMLICAVRAREFKLIVPRPSQVAHHLTGGIMMGIGLAVAVGGNDTQLLLRIPTFSASALSAVAGMLLGIWIFLVVRGRLAATKLKI